MIPHVFKARLLCDRSEKKTSDRISRVYLIISTWLLASFGAFLALAARSSKADVYASPDVQSAYEKKESQFSTSWNPMEEMRVSHATGTENVLSICLESFKVGGQDVAITNGAAYGQGVYTAKGPRTPMCTYGRGEALILCKALPFKISNNVGER